MVLNTIFYKNTFDFYNMIDEESLLANFYVRFKDSDSFIYFDEWFTNLCKKEKYMNDSALECIYYDILKNKKEEYYPLYNVSKKNPISCFMKMIQTEDATILSGFLNDILNDNNQFIFFKAFLMINLHASDHTVNKLEILNSGFRKIIVQEKYFNEIINFCLYSSRDFTDKNFRILDYIEKNYLNNYIIPKSSSFYIDDFKDNLDLLREMGLYHPQQIINYFKKIAEGSYKKFFTVKEIISKFSVEDILHCDINGKDNILHYMLNDRESISESDIDVLKQWFTLNKINLNLTDEQGESFYLLLSYRAVMTKDILWWGLMCGAEPLYKNKSGKCALDLFADYEKPMVLNFLKQKLEVQLFTKKDEPQKKKRL